MQESSFGEQGRVGIQVETTSFAVTPGGSVTIPIILTNHGLEADVVTLAVDGISSSWVSASAASIPLSPGESQQVSLSIQPPHSMQAGAGQHPFRIQATGQLDPGQVHEVACNLTIGDFAEFSSELRPQRVKAGEPARVTVENRGNVQQAFTLTWQSPSDVAFEPAPVQELHVPPGELAIAEFRAAPRQRRFFGSQVAFPFSTRVQSESGETRNHSGEVVGQPLFPSWLLAGLLLGIVICACLVFVLAILGGAQLAAPSEPAAVEPTGEAAQPAPTQAPPEPAPTEPPPEPLPTEPPPEQPAEPSPERPVEEPTPRPTREQAERPTQQPGEPAEPGQSCLPLAFGLILAPALVLFRKRER